MGPTKSNFLILAVFVSLTYFVESKHGLATKNSTDLHYEIFLEFRKLQQIFFEVGPTLNRIREDGLMFYSEGDDIRRNDTSKMNKMEYLKVQVETVREDLRGKGIDVEGCVQFYYELANKTMQNTTGTQTAHMILMNYFEEHLSGFIEIEFKAMDMVIVVQKMKTEAFACEENEPCLTKVLQTMKDYFKEVDTVITKPVQHKFAILHERGTELLLQMRLCILPSLVELHHNHVIFTQCVRDIQSKL